MMISKIQNKDCYIWIWLPGEINPVVVGKLVQVDQHNVIFNYGRSYLERANAISIYDQELPLRAGAQIKTGLSENIPSCIRDSSPDAWGRRVILNKLLGRKGSDADPGDLSEITYLMESGSDRIGALDFQQSAIEYQPRNSKNASLEELLHITELVESGIPIIPELALAINQGTSIGGARPKALIESSNKKYIAKFSASNDMYNVIKAEFLAMRLAQLCGINTAAVELTTAAGKDVLLIERFDRKQKNEGWVRYSILSALTLLDLDEMTARYASYQDFSEIIRYRFLNPKETLKEMFARIVFNILSSNTDDHARNHAAFWDGKNLSLTPAYDICPQMRMGGEATQSMAIFNNNKFSRLNVCLQAAQNFMLNDNIAREIIDQQIYIIKTNWDKVCNQANLSYIDKNLMSKLFMPDYALEGYEISHL